MFINGRRVGGYDELREHFGLKLVCEGDTTYRPVAALFAVAALLGVSVAWLAVGTVFTLRSVEYFVAIAMSLLGLQKLKDVESFSSMFLNYDLLARRYVPYSYFYPYAETAAGGLMLAGGLVWVAAPVALFIGSVGAVSVFKAVYVDKRELKCACIGGDSQVPLGFVSLTENLIMVAMVCGCRFGCSPCRDRCPAETVRTRFNYGLSARLQWLSIPPHNNAAASCFGVNRGLPPRLYDAPTGAPAPAKSGRLPGAGLARPGAHSFGCWVLASNLAEPILW